MRASRDDGESSVGAAVGYGVGVNLAIRVMRPGAPICSAAQANAVRRSAPAQRLDVSKERRVGTQRRQFLEEQREFQAIAEDVRGKLIDRTVARYQPCAVLAPIFGIPG